MIDIFADVEPMVFKSGINVPYSWWAGETAERFFLALRDDKKITGYELLNMRKSLCSSKKGMPSLLSGEYGMG